MQTNTKCLLFCVMEHRCCPTTIEIQWATLDTTWWWLVIHITVFLFVKKLQEQKKIDFFFYNSLIIKLLVDCNSTWFNMPEVIYSSSCCFKRTYHLLLCTGFTFRKKHWPRRVSKCSSGQNYRVMQDSQGCVEFELIFAIFDLLYYFTPSLDF